MRRKALRQAWPVARRPEPSSAALLARRSAPGPAGVGAAIDPPPPPVQTYVLQQPTTGSVVYQGDLMVGQPLPEQVVITPVPDHTTYCYAVVNDRRVIVDPNTRQVVQILD